MNLKVQRFSGEGIVAPAEMLVTLWPVNIKRVEHSLPAQPGFYLQHTPGHALQKRSDQRAVRTVSCMCFIFELYSKMTCARTREKVASILESTTLAPNIVC